MSEIKGQLLGIVLVLTIFAGLVATVTTIVTSLNGTIDSKFTEVKTELSDSSLQVDLPTKVDHRSLMFYEN